MKELIFTKNTQQGIVRGILRVVHKFLYFKYNDSTYSKQAIEEFKKRGLKIKEGKSWIQIDLLGDNETIKLGDMIIENTDSNEDIEEKLFNFYKNQYKLAGFFVETQNEILPYPTKG